MYTDTPRKSNGEGRDPDTYSRTLRDYHLLLWSKPLPNGKHFKLTAKEKPPYYFQHNSDLGEFWLSSDAITHTYKNRANTSMAGIIDKITDIDAFYDLGSTIGAYIIFPANMINKQPTMNMIRGTHRKIDDRFDFTLECIRRWYLGTDSPLFKHIDRYSSFFNLFDNFISYYSFFLLDDLVDNKSGQIRFWLPFEDFGITKPLPVDVDEYNEYMSNVMQFINARNARIVSACS